jgi:cellobiose phosphorylase
VFCRIEIRRYRTCDGASAGEKAKYNNQADEIIANAMSRIGHWTRDSTGLPLYSYQGGQEFPSRDTQGRDAGLSEDPCFILGNYRMTLIVHASGLYQFITGERGWARLNQGGKNRGWNQSLLHVTTSNGATTDYALTGKPAMRQVFGIGHARYDYECDSSLTVSKLISVQPSRGLHQGNPSFLVEVTLTNRGSAAVSVRYREEILACYTMMTDQGVTDRRVRYVNHPSTDAKRGIAKADISCRPAKLLIVPESPQESFTHDITPPTLFIHVKASTGSETSVAAPGDILCGEVVTTLDAGESKTLHFIIGATFEMGDDFIDVQIEDMLTHAQCQANAGAYSHLWKNSLPNLDSETDDILRREMLWNAHTLEAMATYSQYFRETYIPQGSVYAYHLGQNASNRDHLQHAMPLVYTNPPLAKSCIRYAMKHSHADGEIERQNIGFGYCDPGIYMESDPQLYMFMAVGEYLRVTGDYGFLDEEIHLYPMESGKTTTVLNLLTRHFIYLRDVVGTGKHGLIRMLNSDWSDSFFHPYSPNIYSHSAESHMNSTMALAVLPRLSRELRATGMHHANEVAEALCVYHDELHSAVMNDMEGRAFAARCYLGDEPELRFGVDTLCLEPQPFLLLMETFPVERKRQLLHEIKTRVLDMEKSGARTREVPLWRPEGDGEDGGIWFSHQGPLIAGIATFDMEEARKLMHKLTFHSYAEHYPVYWVGHWTAADSLNSTLSKREGLYHAWLDDAFQPFCAHAHAWMLYCYFRLREVTQNPI